MREKDWSKVKWSPNKKPEDKDTTFDMRCKMSFKRRIRRLAERLGTSQAEVIRRAVEALEEISKKKPIDLQIKVNPNFMPPQELLDAGGGPTAKQWREIYLRDD